MAHPSHPLHHLGRPATERDLTQHRQIVIRDSGIRQKVDAGWLGAEQRWTVSHISTSIAALAQGLGFANLPRERISRELEQGVLQQVTLDTEGRDSRSVSLSMAFADRDEAGPAIKSLAGLLRQTCTNAVAR